MPERAEKTTIGPRLAVARGDEPADLEIINARVVNVFTGEISAPQNVALSGGYIAAVGGTRQARQRLDLGGAFLCPGLIDAHVHVESSMVSPFEFARAVVPLGTTTVIADPHEIANVAGADGIRWMLEASEGLDLELLLAASSCVPASHLATSGATLGATELARLLEHPRVVALAEMMNVPGVVSGDPEVLAKLAAFHGRPVDGHCPGLGGPLLNAYCAAGVGSDHETISAEEAREKVRLGMRIFIRESTGAKNLVDLLPAVTAANSRRFSLCTDDRHPHDLLAEGHLDHLIRLAVQHGLDPVTAVQMATLNTAEAFRLTDRGAIAPGRRADLVVVSDLESFRAQTVLASGRVVAENGAPTANHLAPVCDASAVCKPLRIDLPTLELGVPAASGKVRVIGLVPNQVITERLEMELPCAHGQTTCDCSRDVAKLAVIERHHGTGRTGLGFVHGLGLRRGALASTVAHDHHNLIVAGMDDQSMRTAIAEVVRCGGGLAAAHGDTVLASLPLPLGGLMSDQPVEQVRHGLDELTRQAAELGAHGDPFMALSFLALEVIPALRLTDLGLIDVERFERVSLEC